MDREYVSSMQFKFDKKGRGQNLERRNVERQIFQNLKIANIKITKDELFYGFIFEFIFHFLKIGRRSKFRVTI